MQSADDKADDARYIGEQQSAGVRRELVQCPEINVSWIGARRSNVRAWT
ncbi:MAG: hypothetical protein ACI8W7_002564 [Gammaproteobacteria bacterium]|jgi:hypothetical protein